MGFLTSEAPGYPGHAQPDEATASRGIEALEGVVGPSGLLQQFVACAPDAPIRSPDMAKDCCRAVDSLLRADSHVMQTMTEEPRGDNRREYDHRLGRAAPVREGGARESCADTARNRGSDHPYGTHFDANMSSVFFEELDIPPELEPGDVEGPTPRIRVFDGGYRTDHRDRARRFVLVYGDTDSTLAGALAAAKLFVPAAHVEAACVRSTGACPRDESDNDGSPTSSLFAPLRVAVENFSREGMEGDGVRMVGDVMYDSVLRSPGSGRPVRSRQASPRAIAQLRARDAPPEREHGRYRPPAANPGRPRLTDCELVLPLHPRTRQRSDDLGLPARLGRCGSSILSATWKCWCSRECRPTATDSGGVQKEAFFHRVPRVTFRDETEWVELVELGVNPPSARRQRIGAAINRKAEPGRRSSRSPATGARRTRSRRPLQNVDMPPNCGWSHRLHRALLSADQQHRRQTGRGPLEVLCSLGANRLGRDHGEVSSRWSIHRKCS